MKKITFKLSCWLYRIFHKPQFRVGDEVEAHQSFIDHIPAIITKREYSWRIPGWVYSYKIGEKEYSVGAFMRLSSNFLRPIS